MDPIETLRNLRHSAKGQTALEYLLIIVVAIIIVAMVWMFLTTQGGVTTNTAGSAINNILANLP